MNDLETYCSGKFIENIYSRINKPLAEFLDSSNSTFWIADLYRFIHEGCKLITDLSVEEILQRSVNEKSPDYNPNYRKLWKNGRLNLISNPELFEKIVSDKDFFKGRTNEIFLINSESEFCKSIKARHGIICTCPPIMNEDLPNLFIYEIISIKKNGKILSWDFLRKFSYPSNAAIIADNYLLSDATLLYNNLFQILKNILPKRITDSYDLTIFVKDVSNLEQSYLNLHENLSKMFPYEINLTICLTDSYEYRIHDRDILTNYCWYHSGAGFSLFRETRKGIKIMNNTTIYVFPVTQIWNNLNNIEFNENHSNILQGSYFVILEVFKGIWKRIPEFQNNRRMYIGTKKNRLLDK